MPNWCENSLTIDGGDAAAILVMLCAGGLARDAAGDVYVTSLFAASGQDIPTELASRQSPPRPDKDESGHDFDVRLARYMDAYGAADWYDWALAHWGTKWDRAARIVADGSDGAPVVLTFDTAWSPPTTWLATFSAAHPGVTFSLAYCEAGMQFAGVAVYRGGHLISDTEYDGEWYVEPDSDDEDAWWEMSESLSAFVGEHRLAGIGG